MTRSHTVQAAPGYNSWPMIQSLDSGLVCVYSKGDAHLIDEPCRGVYARCSTDGGRTWGAEHPVCNSGGYGEVATGKGYDNTGAALFWVRCCKEWSFPSAMHHELYRTADGIHFEKISVPACDPVPIQISDIFHLPEKSEIAALWFAGDYHGGDNNSWGMLISTDDGRTWKQHVIESGLPKNMWPTEISAVYLGGGRLLAIARRESVPGEAPEMKVQFQLESVDYGRSWKKYLTNINDILESTPSLILTEDGRICNYYYQRTAGLLKRRTAAVDWVWGNPTAWPSPEILTSASRESYHAGNVNAAVWQQRHIIAYYSGNETDTAVEIFPAELP